MRNVWRHIAIPTSLALLGLLFCDTEAIGDQRRHLSAAMHSSAQTAVPTSILTPPPADNTFYREYVSGADPTIFRAYLDQWSYHESRMPYAATSWGHEHFSIGSLDFFDRAPYEGDVRRAFAERVLRLRADAAFKAYFAPSERATGLRRAHKAIQNMRDTSVKISPGKAGGTPTEMRLGYDVFTDSCKVEYVAGKLHAGLYHSYLLGALTGSKPRISPMFLQLRATPVVDLFSASLSYRLDGSYVEAGISRPLSRTMSAGVAHVMPLRADVVPRSYMMSLSFGF